MSSFQSQNGSVPPVVGLLRFMNLIHCDEVPLVLLEEFHKRVHKLGRERGQRFQSLEDALREQEKHGFLARISSQGNLNPSYRMLRRVGFPKPICAESWITIPQSLEFCGIYIAALTASWPSPGDDDSQVKRYQLLPHIHAAVDLPAPEEQKAQWATVVQSAATFANDTNQACFMEKLALKSMEMHRVTVFDNVVNVDTAFKDNPVLRSKAALAAVHLHLCENQKAQKLIEELVLARRIQYGDGDLLTAHSKLALADVHMRQYNFAEAELLLMEAIHTFKTGLGLLNLVTINAYDKLSSIYEQTGREDISAVIYRELNEAMENSGGVGPHEMIAILAGKAGVLRREGEWKEAILVEGDIVEISRDELGKYDPETCFWTLKLAIIYLNLGMFEQAQSLLSELPDDQPSVGPARW